ncbi:polysaccharide deacetylase family protein [Cognatilysobacter tabacisoli]|uniref:polysaccharide deacetylase family protein n=1 Tax=Cognatilysobacter tabacisoli TaxID=2315424 RepID=UPI000E6B11F1|nr:polysaccharide deacetylase family protein [Lysobacter tabacisoli]
MPAASLQRVPRRPHAAPALFVASQLGWVAVWAWAGWRWGVATMMATHAAFLWGTLRPDSAWFSPVLRRLPTEARVVWLTIDDGPSPDTRAMLDLLDAYGAKATFFLVGSRAAARPADVVAIARHRHDVGNHSHRHPAAWFWALGPLRLSREVARTQAVLAKLTGRPPRWFRAVVGMANPFLAAPLRRHGLTRVAWSARGYDAVVATPADVVARIERQLAPGAIVLLHEGAAHGRSVETLALLLKRLDELGYRCVLPDELSAGTAAVAAPAAATSP